MAQQDIKDDGVKDLYDSERAQIQKILYAMRLKHSFKGVKTIDQEEAIMRTFATEMGNRCAEIGLIVDIQWDPDVSDDPDDNTLYWNPRVIVTGRTHKLEEYDHDRQQWEMQKGILEEPGFIRADGSIHEEPKKKLIL